MAKPVDDMSVKELKNFINEHGLEFTDCIEKHHLQERAREAEKLEVVPVASRPQLTPEPVAKPTRLAAPAPKDDLYCSTCKKKFQSKPKMKEHLKSKKHKDALKSAAAPKSAAKKKEQKSQSTKSTPAPVVSAQALQSEGASPEEAVVVDQANMFISTSEVESTSEKVGSCSTGADTGSDSELIQPADPAQEQQPVEPRELTAQELKRAAIEEAVAAARITQTFEKLLEQDTKITRAANDADLAGLVDCEKSDSRKLHLAQRSAQQAGDKSLTVSQNQIGSRSSFVKSFLKP